MIGRFAYGVTVKIFYVQRLLLLIDTCAHISDLASRDNVKSIQKVWTNRIGEK